MAEDIAFRIQLGIILPKLKDQIAGDLSAIIEELVQIVSAGTLGDEQVSLDEVKDIIMKDLEIFLDDAILPEIDKKRNPPQESVDAGESAEGVSDDGEAEAEAEESSS